MNKPKFQIGERIYLNDLYSENPEEWGDSTVVGIIADIINNNQLSDEDISYLYIVSKTGLYKHRYSEDALIKIQEYQEVLEQWKKEQEEIELEREYDSINF